MNGTILNDRYRLDQELGRGGMGVVYRGRDLLLQREVAVKVVSGAGLNSEGRERLFHEAQLAAGLDHRHIITVFDVGDALVPSRLEPVTYIVMQLVEGRSLRVAPPASLDEILDIACQICDALEVVHRRGLVHGDLKPDNVLVTAGGQIKLLDFGLAHSPSNPDLDRDYALKGTLAYLAPELIRGQEASPQSDLYALGMMLYELLTGRTPFNGSGPAALLSQHLHATIVPPSTYNYRVPATLDRLIVSMVSKRVAERPDSASRVRWKLESIRAEWVSRSEILDVVMG